MVERPSAGVAGVAGVAVAVEDAAWLGAARSGDAAVASATVVGSVAASPAVDGADTSASPCVSDAGRASFTRVAADSFGYAPHFTTMIDFDKFLFFGEAPTVWLQDRIYDPDTVHWWDVCFTFIYTSHFIVPFAVAGVLWARSRDAFVKFSRRFVTLSAAGLATYIAFPAAPPWMASEQGLLPPIARSTARGWEVVNLHAAESFSKGQGIVNLVAAVPSLHAAFAMLTCLFLWSRVRWYWRPLLALYPLAMGFSLVATGEHYVFDILLGWTYTVIAVLVVNRVADRMHAPASRQD